MDATQYEGWFYEGAGIYRHVWLHKRNNLHIGNDGVFLHAKIKDADAVLTAEIEIENENFTTSPATVQTIILDRTGKKLVQSPGQEIIISEMAEAHSKSRRPLEQTGSFSTITTFAWGKLPTV